MAQANYTEIARHLERGEAFKGNTASATIDPTEYAVYSYTTLIASMTFDGSKWNYWVSPKRYSNTTSRLQNLVKKAWGI